MCRNVVKHRSREGRIGNQLFEHAATLALAKNSERQACIIGRNVDLLDKYFIGPFYRNCTDAVLSKTVGEAGFGIFNQLPMESDVSIGIHVTFRATSISRELKKRSNMHSR